MNTWLCMPMNITPVLQGNYYSNLQTSLDVVLSACKMRQIQVDPAHLKKK